MCRCEWKGNKCDPDTFIPSFTDFGKCYTFNSLKKDSNESNYQTSRIGKKTKMFAAVRQERLKGKNWLDWLIFCFAFDPSLILINFHKFTLEYYARQYQRKLFCSFLSILYFALHFTACLSSLFYLFSSLLTFMGSYAYWCEPSYLTHYSIH